jgi:hypothetical protein
MIFSQKGLRMKRLVLGLGILASFQISGTTGEQEEIKHEIGGLGYPTVIMIREAKNIPDDLLIDIVGRWRVINAENNEFFKKCLAAIRTLTEGDLALLKKTYEEDLEREAEDAKQWNSPEAVARRKQEEALWEAQKMRQQEFEKAHETATIEAKNPALLAVINGFVESLDKPDVVAAVKSFAQQFVAQWKSKIDAQQQAKLAQIMDLVVQASEIVQKTNGNVMALMLGGGDEASQKLSQEFQPIIEQLTELANPYLSAMQRHISQEKIDKFESEAPEIFYVIAQEFKGGK